MLNDGGTGRTNQKTRTRTAIVDACRELMRTGAIVTVPDVARLALVSEATAYRYFPDLATLLNRGARWPLAQPSGGARADRAVKRPRRTHRIFVRNLPPARTCLPGCDTRDDLDHDHPARDERHAPRPPLRLDRACACTSGGLARRRGILRPAQARSRRRRESRSALHPHRPLRPKIPTKP